MKKAVKEKNKSSCRRRRDYSGGEVRRDEREKEAHGEEREIEEENTDGKGIEKQRI